MVSKSLYSPNPAFVEEKMIEEITYDRRTMEPIFTKKRVLVSVAENVQVDKVEGILVLRDKGLGDVVMSLVAVRALRERFQKKRIRFACNQEYLPIVEGCPYVDEVIGIENGVSPGRNEVVFDLRLSVESKEIAGKIDRELYLSMNRIDIFLKHVGALGGKQNIEIWLRGSDIQWANEIVEKIERNGKRIIGIQASCASPVRSWPDYYTNDFVRLLDKDKYIVIGLGEPHLWPWVKYEFNGKGVIDMVGKTDVGKIAALIGLLDVFVGVDSGLLHLAAAQKVKSVALFGNIDPDLRLRYYRSVLPVLPEEKLPCLTCGDLPPYPDPRCYDFENQLTIGGVCMRAIPPETVVAAVESVLEGDKRCVDCGGIAKNHSFKAGVEYVKCQRCKKVFINKKN